ncbi:acyl-CoA thioesterase [Empedobacter brevis]|uniref:Acyl-CoA thioesterase n=1 Tax=Empedobacter brevis TaxID=247 RepID=A0AAJ1QDX9_9FLAO|nr:acyl-CoA thioesterase [Empedobacter brevis]MDM1072303.1 acyl-CoA thioesterase [Empedobacter brevis]QES92251.1 acyl-CoA thioesterase [Empedobacter brevis]QHC84008.1 acyl-CoA thioesterase [Empedobacter brevis]
MAKAKKAIDSLAVMTNLVLPNETNNLGNMFGGELLAAMDRISSISAKMHGGSFLVVTASVNHVAFNIPIPMGSTIKLESKVTRAFNSSMEVYVDVFVYDYENCVYNQTNSGIYTFVAVDNDNKPVAVPELIPESPQEIERFNAALRRKQLSLILAGRMQPSEAHELKSLFIE